MDANIEVGPQHDECIALIEHYHEENNKLQNKINLFKLMSIIMILVVLICLLHQTYHEEDKDIKSMTERIKQLNENLNKILSELNVEKVLNNDLEKNCKYNENECNQCKQQNTSLNENLKTCLNNFNVQKDLYKDLENSFKLNENKFIQQSTSLNENLKTCLNDFNVQKDLYKGLENSFKLNENKWNQYKEESTSPKEPTSNIHNYLLKLWFFAFWLFIICFMKILVTYELPPPNTHNVIDRICVNYIGNLCILSPTIFPLYVLYYYFFA